MSDTTLTDQQKSFIRYFCGYPDASLIGHTALSTDAEHQKEFEDKLNNLVPAEYSSVMVCFELFPELELKLEKAQDLSDKIKDSGVEVKEFERDFRDLRFKICRYISVNPGPNLRKID